MVKLVEAYSVPPPILPCQAIHRWVSRARPIGGFEDTMQLVREVIMPAFTVQIYRSVPARRALNMDDLASDEAGQERASLARLQELRKPADRAFGPRLRRQVLVDLLLGENPTQH